MYRSTYIEINNKTLLENVKEIKKEYNNYKYYIAMVKSNAYGHGYYIVNDLIESGINYFAVSSLEEALEIRKYNKDIPVLCVEPIELDCIDIAIKNNITLTIVSYDYIKKLLIKTKSKFKIHIKIDTGMNRLGISSKDEFNKVINRVIKIVNVYQR